MRYLAEEIKSLLIDISEDTTHSVAVQRPEWAIQVGIYIAQIVDGIVYLEISKDGTTYVKALDPDDGAAFVVCASTSDPGYIDVSEIVASIPSTWYMRLLTSGTQITTDRQCYAIFRG